MTITDEMVEAAARAVMEVMGCGVRNSASERVLCNHPSLESLCDACGNPMRYEVCECILQARAALEAVLPMVVERINPPANPEPGAAPPDAVR